MTHSEIVIKEKADMQTKHEYLHELLCECIASAFDLMEVTEKLAISEPLTRKYVAFTAGELKKQLNATIDFKATLLDKTEGVIKVYTSAHFWKGLKPDDFTMALNRAHGVVTLLHAHMESGHNSLSKNEFFEIANDIFSRVGEAETIYFELLEHG